ncbi:MAG TPA: choice-of-anchor Q domain-containing protein [Armatimonadota bacterium]|jgi:hypothetical protein
MFLAALFVMIALLPAARAVAGVLHVSRSAPGATQDGLSWATAYPTVQKALDAAADGDEVWVHAGTYQEHLTTKADVSLYGGFAGTETGRDQRDWRADVTTLDGTQSGRVLISNHALTLDGFTVTNGLADYGGGLLVSSYSTVYKHYQHPLILANDAFASNKGTEAGGAVVVEGDPGTYVSGNVTRGLVTVSDTTFTSNTSPFGGAMWLYYTDGTISHSVFSSNTGTTVGGAVDCSVYADVTVSDNAFENNTGRFGGAMRSVASAPVIRNNTFTGNTATSNAEGGGSGGAIYCEPTMVDTLSVGGSPTISANAFNGNSAVVAGGGVYSTNSSPTVVENTFTSNAAGQAGGAICFYHTSSRIAGNVFDRNSNTGGNGGALFLNGSTSIIDRNTFTGNSVVTSDPTTGGGGAIFWYDSNPIFAHNVVAGNSANYGGAIYAYRNTGIIANNLIAVNQGIQESGGIELDLAAPLIASNTIVENTGTLGAAISHQSSDTPSAAPSIVNNIIAFNASGYYKDAGSLAPLLSRNDVFSNGTADYAGIDDPTGQNGNLKADPAFVDRAALDFHLSAASPCIDSGDDFVIPMQTDLDGKPRVSGLHIDMGALEAARGAGPSRHYVDQRAQGPVHDGLSWATAFPTVQEGCFVAGAGGGGEVWVAAGTYVEGRIVYPGLDSISDHLYTGFDLVQGIVVYPGVALYGGFAGDETQRAQRDWQANATILDGDQYSPAVFVPEGAGAASAVDGFTLRNGWSGLQGGGALIDGVADLANDTVTANLGRGVWVAGTATMERCAVSGNITGLEIAAPGSATVTDSVIEGNQYGGVSIDGRGTLQGNTISGNNGGSGVFVSETGTATLDGNTIAGNDNRQEVGEGWSGGISVSGTAVITRNTVSRNQADRAAGVAVGGTAILAGNTIESNVCNADGAGVSVYGTASLSGDTVVRNVSIHGIGGVYVDAQGHAAIASSTIAVNSGLCGGLEILGAASVANVTVSDNHGSSYSSIPVGHAGGIVVSSTGPVTVENSIVAYNSSGLSWEGNAPVWRHNDVYGNIAYDYSPYEPNLTGTYSNISQDPLLSSVHTNVHLEPGSPCIDAGSDAAVSASETDIDGQPRIQGAHVDIGADEWDDSITPAPVRTVYHVSPAGRDTYTGLSWGRAKRTLRAALAAAEPDDEIWVAKGKYVETNLVPARVSLYGGFRGTETRRGQRDPKRNATVLDGGKGGTVLAELNGVTVDGFTVQNGASGGPAGFDSAGGVWIAYGFGTLSHCDLASNAGDGVEIDGARGGDGDVSHCLIRGNSGVAGGVSVFLAGPSAPSTISNSVLSDNSGWDGGVDVASGAASLVNDIIAAGEVEQPGYGGAVGIHGGDYGEPKVTLENCIVALNTAGVFADVLDPHAVMILHSDVYGNTAGNFAGIPDPTGTDGNISADPQFAGAPMGDYHLARTSPGVDAGDDAAVPAGETDEDGRPRLLGEHVDMGAYEFPINIAQSLPPGAPIHGSPSAGLVDGDRVIAVEMAGALHLLRAADLTDVASFAPVDLDAEVHGRPMFGSIAGRDVVAVGTSDGRLLVFDAMTGEAMDVGATGPLGSAIDTSPAIDSVTGDVYVAVDGYQGGQAAVLMCFSGGKAVVQPLAGTRITASPAYFQGMVVTATDQTLYVLRRDGDSFTPQSVVGGTPFATAPVLGGSGQGLIAGRTGDAAVVYQLNAVTGGVSPQPLALPAGSAPLTEGFGQADVAYGGHDGHLYQIGFGPTGPRLTNDTPVFPTPIVAQPLTLHGKTYAVDGLGTIASAPGVTTGQFGPPTKALALTGPYSSDFMVFASPDGRLVVPSLP